MRKRMSSRRKIIVLTILITLDLWLAGILSPFPFP
jgi:hypothetical protein